MSRMIIFAIGFLLLLAVTYLYLVRVPLRKGYLGPVSLSMQGYQTNQAGQVSALIGISNGGPHIIRFAFGTQVLRNSVWVDSASGSSNHFNLSIEADPVIPAHGQRVVSVVIPATGSAWRGYALCQKEYPEHWSKTLRWVADAYVLKRGVVEHFYSPDIQR